MKKGKKLLIASTTLKACNDMIIMIIIGELLSKTVFPPYRSGIYIHDNPDKQEDDDENVVEDDNLDDNTALQRINHPVLDNLASRAAPLSR